MNFSSVDLTLSLDDFSKRIIQPAISVLAANVESDALTMYKDTYNQVNNQASAASFAKALGCRKILVDNLAPPGDLNMCLATQDNVDLVDALKVLYQDDSQLSKQYLQGKLGRAAGFDWFENTLLPAHSRGAGNASYVVDTRTSAIAITSTAITSITVATGSGALNDGDIFTIGNVYRVHPETKAQTTVLQQFVVTADTGSGAGSWSISPSIVTAGPAQNVTIPTVSSAAVITVAGLSSSTHGISLAFHKDAYAFATADLVMPDGVDFASRQTMDGISMRIVRAYDINNDKFPCRIDVLYGYKAIRPQLACRFANN